MPSILHENKNLISGVNYLFTYILFIIIIIIIFFFNKRHNTHKVCPGFRYRSTTVATSNIIISFNDKLDRR
jgi:hypothetical protein